MGSKTIITAGIAASALIGAAIALSKSSGPAHADAASKDVVVPTPVEQAKETVTMVIEEIEQGKNESSFDAASIQSVAVGDPELEEIADLDEAGLDIIAKIVNQQIEFEEKPIDQQRPS